MYIQKVVLNSGGMALKQAERGKKGRIEGGLFPHKFILICAEKPYFSGF